MLIAVSIAVLICTAYLLWQVWENDLVPEDRETS
jgi:hypothetical protein